MIEGILIMLKVIVVSICFMILVITLFKIIQAVIQADSRKEKLAILLMLTEPADTVTYLFYISLFGLIAGMLLL